MTFADLLIRLWRHVVGFFALLFLALYDVRFVGFIVLVCALAALAKAFENPPLQRQSDATYVIYNERNRRG